MERPLIVIFRGFIHLRVIAVVFGSYSTARSGRAVPGKTLYVLAMSNITIGGIAAPVVRLGRISDIAR